MADTPGVVTMPRVVTALIVVAARAFAVEGGEYGTLDLMRQREQAIRVHARIDSLEHAVDSLERLERALATDAALQERIARENWRMVKGEKERVYVFRPEAGSSRR